MTKCKIHTTLVKYGKSIKTNYMVILHELIKRHEEENKIILFYYHPFKRHNLVSKFVQPLSWVRSWLIGNTPSILLLSIGSARLT